MSSRRNPSVSKVQLLMHLRECHQRAAKACDRNARLISKLFVSPFLPVQQHVHRSQLYVDDLRYLIHELDAHAQEMDKLKEVIVAQIDLSDKRRNRNIGVFIAMYVPLAFATVGICSGARYVIHQLILIVLLRNEHRGSICRHCVEQHHIC